MEGNKRLRTQLRKEFTKLANQIDAAQDLPYEIFNLLSETATNLFEVETQIREKWCAAEDYDEKSFEEDQNKAMSYKMRWHKIKAVFSKRERKDSFSSLHSAESIIDTTKKRKPKLPKLEISKFDGKITSWLQFWGQFKKIDEDKNIDLSDKFQYLLHSMVPDSSAQHLVQSYPPSGDNYPKAVEALKARFARDDLLIETYVRGLLSLMQCKDRTRSMSTLYDNIQTHLQALETLGVTKDKYAAMLFPMIESALPEEILRAWHRSHQASRDLSSLMRFLRNEVESDERIRLARDGFDELSIVEPKPPTACFLNESKKNTSVAQDRPSSSNTGLTACIWCDKSTHSATECHKASKMELQERVKFLRKKNACQICLKSNHITKKCKSFPKCLFCKKRHYTIMCMDLATANNTKNSDNNNQNNNTRNNNVNNHSEPGTSSNLSCQTSSKTTLLQTFVAKIVHGKKELCLRVLIDSGAQRSFIKKDVVDQLGLKCVKKEVLTQCLFGGFQTSQQECQVFDICLRSLVNNFKVNLTVVGQNNLCGYLPRIRSNNLLRELRQKGIYLTDSNCDSPDDVSLLIGADFSGSLLTGEFIHLNNNITAVNTKLGWTVQGPITGVFSSIANTTTTLHCLNKVDISDLWSLEALGIKDPAEQASKSARSLDILKSFEETIRVNEEGRYEVFLPWRDCPRPQENYELAKKRLDSTMNRLKQLGKVNDYDHVFLEWLQLNIIERAPDQSVKGHYMPHHAVIKEASLTTKIRPVFDASAKDRNGISLNSCLEKGVNLMEQIPNLLINFRRNKIGVTADIAKAFLQISIVPEDRDYLRFLWWDYLNDVKIKELVSYRHRRVVFGITSSPFHLVATINHHLNKCSERLRDTAMKLKSSFYVDNCVTSLESEEELDRFIKESKEVMLDGKFDLRGWISSPKLVDENVESTSILGVLWNVKNDSLQCNVNLKNFNENLTKRTLLSVAQRIFDPIGFTCPTTVIPKMILQSSWCRKLTWDEPLPDDLAKEFKKWLDQAHLINECVIPRRLTVTPIESSKVSLHVFCDSSKDAYSACIFMRSQQGENVNVSLVLAKSRVTPVKSITIPRLELIAATLACRLSATAIESLAIPNCDVCYWTDSSVVLTWIKCDGPWTVFVTNRVKEILSLSNASSWRHVPGCLNPADLPSRGIHPKRLVESKWWEGPSWLRLNEELWPASEIGFNSSEVNEERREVGTHAMLVEEESFLSRLTYFSNYAKIIRMVCWMLRLKRRPASKELTYEEFEYAENIILRLVQRKHEDSLLNDKKLHTFVDDNRIIRLNTKLSLGSEDDNFKFPMVLPGGELIVRRLVERRHIELQHAGAQTLLCNLRQTFWIVGQRKLIRNVISKCIRCKRFKAKHSQAPTGVLPKERMEASSPFQFSGVDLAGPLLLRSGTKAWIVLFTCATYRAVHLEVVESLSTAEFLMALRRFVARRGRVECLFSDNATNFRGLNNAFKNLDWDEVQRFSSITRIKWNFLPPAAPWWGGFYERLIGFLKQILRRVLGRASLTLVELQTILCDCEAVINGRPLTCVGDKDDLQPMTPSMFIQPLSSSHVTDFDKVDGQSLQVRQKYCQKLREDLRARFRSEYLSLLIQKRDASSRQAPLQVGDVVLVETEDKKRVSWPLAVVQSVAAGADGVCRVVQIRTSNGVKTRPVQRLFPLELNSDQG